MFRAIVSQAARRQRVAAVRAVVAAPRARVTPAALAFSAAGRGSSAAETAEGAAQPSASVDPATVQDQSAASQTDGEFDIGKHQRRIIYRAKNRGVLELDVLMGTFAQENVPSMSVAELAEFAEVTSLENPDLQRWLVGQQPVPDELQDCAMLMRLVKYAREEHEPDLSWLLPDHVSARKEQVDQ